MKGGYMQNRNNIKRVFASFKGTCPFQCLHCYTFNSEFQYDKCGNNIDTIVKKLEDKDFNIIYVSGYTENFFIPSRGIELLEALYIKYKCNILFTTRNIFNSENINRISELNKKMKMNGNLLFACISISAYNSYKKLEPNIVIPTPDERINFMETLKKHDILTILTLRPVCPNEYINTEEYLNIIDKSKNYCDAIISSSIIVDDTIMKNLKEFPKNIKYIEKPIMNCLKQKNLNMKYLDLKKELLKIKNYSVKNNIPFFKKSIPAIDYFLKKGSVENL